MVFEKTLPILIFFLIGLGLKRVLILKKEHAPLLSQLILYVVLPATILNSISHLELSFQLLALPLAGLIVIIALLCVGFILAFCLGLRGATRGAFIVAMPSWEMGAIGYIFMVTVYGAIGLATMVAFDLGETIFFFTALPIIAAWLGQTHQQFRAREMFLQFLRSPMIWACGIGIMLNFWHIHLDLLSPVLTNLSQTLLLLIMLLVAIECDLSFSSLRGPFLAMYLKTAIGLSVGVLVSLLFHMTGISQIAVVFGSSLPASMLCVPYARQYGLDSRFLSSMLSLALPSFIVFSIVLFTFVY